MRLIKEINIQNVSNLILRFDSDDVHRNLWIYIIMYREELLAMVISINKKHSAI